jgi:hypothetical protein
VRAQKEMLASRSGGRDALSAPAIHGGSLALMATSRGKMTGRRLVTRT